MITKADLLLIVRGLAPVLREYTTQITERLAALDAKAKGLDGKDGKDGAPGLRGADGPEGLPGRDGRDGQPGVQGFDGKDGVNGKDGADGLGFDDLDAVYDEMGRMSLRFSRGDVTKSFRVPGLLDRGVWKDGTAYEKGDGVTFGGSFWIARAVTTEKPGDGATAWRLAVKTGRAGRDGQPGPIGPSGAKGERGEAGRDYR